MEAGIVRSWEMRLALEFGPLNSQEATIASSPPSHDTGKPKYHIQATVEYGDLMKWGRETVRKWQVLTTELMGLIFSTLKHNDETITTKL